MSAGIHDTGFDVADRRATRVTKLPRQGHILTDTT